ncbi:response regulator transcription factor [Solimonas marina]|uniref:Helix-turn-helix transcriptional regulator n=1 Tax=Solimonas marina TaxID=2714601 RepID=A0A969W7A2_9GAMM|nr:helix-turn-helix transcriptional regulator [Solimonas marina]NKF20793.1 helix-turn-helix transcriptional regulator [Solimonas marina]
MALVFESIVQRRGVGRAEDARSALTSTAACACCSCRAAGPAPYFNELSPRERELFDLILMGYTTRRCAQVMRVSTKTAENHRARMMDKLGARNVVELCRYAWRYGLMPPEVGD